MHESKDFGIASDSEDELPSPEEQRERALKLAERWRYDEDGGRWAGLGLLGLGGMEGDEEAVLDDYDHRFVRYRMSLLDETNLLKLSTDWTYMRQALAAAEMHPSDAQAAAATKPGAQPTADTKQAHPAHDEQAATARALDRLGLAATGVGWPAAHQWPGLLGTARRIGGSGWERWLGPGARGIAEVLREL